MRLKRKSKVRRGKYIGNCTRCMLVLMAQDRGTKCPRCYAQVPA